MVLLLPLPVTTAPPIKVIPSPPLPQPRLNPKGLKPRPPSTDSIVSWTSRISLLSRNGRLAEAATAFSDMRLAGVEPNHITFIALLTGCANFPEESKILGDSIHGYVCKLGLDKTHVMVGTAILCMYAKRSCIDYARTVFDYMEVKNSMTWNSLIDGYMRNEQVDEAVKVFAEMPERDLISWTALINGFVRRHHFEEALACFREMQISETKPDYVTIVAVLAACTNLGALSFGLWVHRYILNQDYKNNVRVNNSLIDLYCRCGCVEFAKQVFDKMEARTVVSWNSMIAGFAANGYAREALLCFNQMQKEGHKPDAVTFTGALTACSHAGLVEKGLEYFQSIKKDHRISLRIEHYGCLVDLYSRAGRLEEALDVIEKMRVKPNKVVIGSLLAACRTHGNNTDLAERLMKSLDVKSHSNYVTLANMYAAAGKWKGASELRRKMKGLGSKKSPGYSSLEINDHVHTFMAGDRSHVRSDRIYQMLHLLSFDSGFQDNDFEIFTS